jgi:hypothetical protein
LQTDADFAGALVREQINSIEKTRPERLERAPDTGPHAMMRLLARVIPVFWPERTER